MSELAEKVSTESEKIYPELIHAGHSLDNNPFYVLGSSPCEGLEALTDRYEDAIDDHLINEREALRLYQLLSSSLPRLAAEVSWLPGVEADEAQRAVKARWATPPSEWPPLAAVNFRFAMLAGAGETVTSSDLKSIIQLWATVESESVTEIINRQRDASGFPLVNRDQVESELSRCIQAHADALFALLSKDEKALPGVLSEALESAQKTSATSTFINCLVALYQRWVQRPLDRLADEIDDKLPALRKLLDEELEDEREIDADEYRVIEEALIEKLRDWAECSKPLRLSSYRKGLDEPRSAAVVGSYLNNALALNSYAPASALNIANAAYEMTQLMPRLQAKAEEVVGILQEVRDLNALEESEPDFCHWAGTLEEESDKLEWNLVKHQSRSLAPGLENNFFQELIELLQRAGDEETMRGAWVRISEVVAKLKKPELIIYAVHQLVEIEKHYPFEGVSGKRLKARWNHVLWIEIQAGIETSMLRGMKGDFSRWVEKGYERFRDDEEKRRYLETQQQAMENMPDDALVSILGWGFAIVVLILFIFLATL
ncbi:hypothetical protein [Halomonas salipaludis]|uniref:Uncharacterized protein n=1 Tax=Halomonas salipaludis TaxID=2032625 RepID=A0A2A2F4C8_9GAMM|nr:hypothetical protein [Halomonas salipaludis]PAU79479.1 hypothetical protein CK498_03705 [Halomonas salipaludis]